MIAPDKLFLSFGRDAKAGEVAKINDFTKFAKKLREQSVTENAENNQ